MTALWMWHAPLPLSVPGLHSERHSSSPEDKVLSGVNLVADVSPSSDQHCCYRGASGLSPVPFSKEEAEQVAAQLMEAAPLNLPNNNRQPNAQPTEQKPTLRSKGSFKGLFSFKGEALSGSPLPRLLPARIAMTDQYSMNRVP